MYFFFNKGFQYFPFSHFKDAVGEGDCNVFEAVIENMFVALSSSSPTNCVFSVILLDL